MQYEKSISADVIAVKCDVYFDWANQLKSIQASPH